MPRYLVEVSQPEPIAAKRIAESVSKLGSHFATHADWRHRNGVTTGTLVVEAGDRWGALGIVPPGMRTAAKIFELEPSAAVSPPVEFSNEPYAIAA